ncbi:hypothetical protein [Delftia tsuruhatensis]|uniref:hypothetical protein n=1 Tax=Delftia tsuruhatensis TaxID=180282 RepID=UPI001F2AEF78|nr:hypothetical protein [Delftia tsuruhatensis]
MKDFNKNRVNEDALEADDDVVIYNGVPFNGVGFDNFADGSVIEYETEYKKWISAWNEKKKSGIRMVNWLTLFLILMV